MKIGLLDVDGHNFPNLAQMKLSAWHKKLGSQVERLNPLVKYDVVYCSKVFDFTPDYDFNIQSDRIFHGGIGYGFEKDQKLDFRIEHIMPDYSLYGITDHAYGFLSRGCPRDCSFCNVTQHQGNQSIKVADIDEFWNGQKFVTLLDPNILACKDSLILLDQLKQSKSYVDFSQGLDARLINDQNIDILKQIKLKSIHFAWDGAKDFKTGEKLELIAKETGWNRSKIQVYVLVNFDSTLEEDLHRIMKIKELNFAPYVMIYEKDKLPKKHIIRHLQRYVNNRYIFWSNDCLTFNDYLKRIEVIA
jgi:radical SAM superfamily enzyme YgiQ (UPF0313 family)